MRNLIPVLAVVLLLSGCASRRSICPPTGIKNTTTAKHVALTVAEHLALGTGTEVAVSQAAGGNKKYGAGLLATGIMASVKEGSDVIAHRDTKKMAVLHALTIMLGAGAATAIKH